jgi:hypothetical protein
MSKFNIELLGIINVRKFYFSQIINYFLDLYYIIKYVKIVIYNYFKIKESRSFPSDIFNNSSIFNKMLITIYLLGRTFGLILGSEHNNIDKST